MGKSSQKSIFPFGMAVLDGQGRAHGAIIIGVSLNQIYASALRAKELVLQILTFSRQEGTEYKPVKIQHILKEVIKLLRSTIPRNIEIKQSIDPGCTAVNADATQIHQIVMNLATNAFHAMGDVGGEFKIYFPVEGKPTLNSIGDDDPTGYPRCFMYGVQ